MCWTDCLVLFWTNDDILHKISSFYHLSFRGKFLFQSLPPLFCFLNWYHPRYFGDVYFDPKQSILDSFLNFFPLLSECFSSPIKGVRQKQGLDSELVMHWQVSGSTGTYFVLCETVTEVSYIYLFIPTLVTLETKLCTVAPNICGSSV